MSPPRPARFRTVVSLFGATQRVQIAATWQDGNVEDEEPPLEEAPIATRPFLMKVKGQTFLVIPHLRKCVHIRDNYEWNLTPTQEQVGVVEYVLDAEGQPEGTKPRWAHQLLDGKRAKEVVDEEIIAEIQRRRLGLKDSLLC